MTQVLVFQPPSREASVHNQPLPICTTPTSDVHLKILFPAIANSIVVDGMYFLFEMSLNCLSQFLSIPSKITVATILARSLSHWGERLLSLSSILLGLRRRLSFTSHNRAELA